MQLTGIGMKSACDLSFIECLVPLSGAIPCLTTGRLRWDGLLTFRILFSAPVFLTLSLMAPPAQTFSHPCSELPSPLCG